MTKEHARQIPREIRHLHIKSFIDELIEVIRGLPASNEMDYKWWLDNENSDFIVLSYIVIAGYCYDDLPPKIRGEKWQRLDRESKEKYASVIPYIEDITSDKWNRFIELRNDLAHQPSKFLLWKDFARFIKMEFLSLLIRISGEHNSYSYKEVVI